MSGPWAAVRTWISRQKLRVCQSFGRQNLVVVGDCTLAVDQLISVVFWIKLVVRTGRCWDLGCCRD